MTSDFQRRGPLSGRPGALPSLLCFPRVGPEFGSHTFGQSCGVPPLTGLVLEGLAWSTPSPSPCPQGTRLATLTPFLPSCTGVLHWSSPAGRASRGHLRAGGAALCAREGPASILAPLLLPHSASWTAPPDQDTPCRLALSGTSCPSSLVGAHFRETDSKATAFPPQGADQAASCTGTLCPTVCPWCPRAWLQDPVPPCPGQPPALPTQSSRFCM